MRVPVRRAGYRFAFQLRDPDRAAEPRLIWRPFDQLKRNQYAKTHRPAEAMTVR